MGRYCRHNHKSLNVSTRPSIHRISWHIQAANSVTHSICFAINQPTRTLNQCKLDAINMFTQSISQIVHSMDELTQSIYELSSQRTKVLINRSTGIFNLWIMLSKNLFGHPSNAVNEFKPITTQWIRETPNKPTQGINIWLCSPIQLTRKRGALKAALYLCGPILVVQ